MRNVVTLHLGTTLHFGGRARNKLILALADMLVLVLPSEGWNTALFVACQAASASPLNGGSTGTTTFTDGVNNAFMTGLVAGRTWLGRPDASVQRSLTLTELVEAESSQINWLVFSPVRSALDMQSSVLLGSEDDNEGFAHWGDKWAF